MDISRPFQRTYWRFCWWGEAGIPAENHPHAGVPSENHPHVRWYWHRTTLMSDDIGREPPSCQMILYNYITLTIVW